MRFIQHPIDWDDEKVSRLWDYYSRTPPYSETYFSKVFGDRILRTSKLPLQEPLDVLDFGCGPAHIWEHMLKMGVRWNYTALDFSLDSVAEAREKAGSHPQFKGAQHITKLPSAFGDGAFDAVLLIEVIEHLSDAYLDDTLRETARLVRPGGVVVITTPNNEDLAASTKFCPDCGAVFHEWQHVRSWNLTSLDLKLQRHGFVRRMAQALDFSASGVIRRSISFARRLLRKHRPPHIIAVYHKPRLDTPRTPV
jgi:2-polyprenyl-3-methyl-5-hydroxy-6-metoxy-1,4-benzoquinol methylase